VTYTVTAPAPQLNSLMPGSANSGDAAFTLTVTGVYFSPNAIVKWNGGARTTTYVSATQLTAQISAADIASPGQYAVSVSDQTPGIPDSSTIFFTVNGPGISTLTPSLVTAGAPGFTLAVSGFFLTPQTVVLWNGSLRPTTYVSGNQLTALIGASDLASAGTVTVTVANGPNGVPSAGTPFVIAPLPALALNSLSPTKVSAGGGPFVLTVFGNGFTGSSVVTWNGTNLATSYLSTTTLRAPVAATQIANPGTAAIAVVNPPGQGGTSPAVNLTIESPSIDAVSYQVNPAHTGAVSFKSVTFPASSLWSVNVGGAASYALIVGGRVFVTVSVNGNSQLLALDASTGATLWGPIALAGGSANAAYDAGTLFVVSGAPLSSPTLSALDPATGNSKWSSPVSGGSVPAPPVAADGVVYTIDDGLVTALDETSGVTLWNQEVTGTSGTVAVAVDGIYASAPCTTYALQPAIGSTLWTHNTGCEGGGGATPVVANGVLYSPIGVNGYSGTIYDAETGTVQGTFAASYLPALTSTTGFFLTNSTLQGIARSNNQILWSFTGDGALVTSPLVVNNYVIVGSANGNLYALDGATGSQVWTKNLGAPLPMTAPDTSGIYSGLSAGDGLLVVPSGTSVTAYVLSTNP
jgi:outer membrane protein assembly factor BamB